MTDRFRLFLVWFVGFAGSLLTISIYSFVAISIDDISEVLGSATISLAGIFAPYLTPIVAFWFAQEVIQKVTPIAEGPYRVAFICSIFYNALFLLMVCSLFFFDASDPQFAVEQILTLASQISTGLAFLVGPAIGFYFGKTGQSHIAVSDQP